MGKSKRAWKQIEDQARDDVVEPEDSAKHLANSNLFFVDAKGNAGGAEDLKRRKKRTLEQAPVPVAKEQKTSVAVEPASMPTPMDTKEPESAPVMSQPVSQVSRWKKRHTAWVATKQARKQDDKERKINLGQAGMKFDPEVELQDIWADQNPEKGVLLEKARNRGFEIDVTPLETRKRVYMRPRSKKHTERAKELVDSSGVPVCPAGASFNPDEDQRQEALQVAFTIDEKERTELAKLNKQLNPPSNVVENALPEEDDESELFPSKKPAKPKTKTQKNAKLRQIQEVYDKEKEKTQTKLGKQLNRLGSILSEVKNSEKRDEARRKAMEKLKENPDHRPKIGRAHV